MAPQVGDSFPENVSFSYVPYTEEKAGITACGIPVTYDASKGKSCPSITLPVGLCSTVIHDIVNLYIK